MEAHVSFTVSFSPSAFVSLLFLIFLLTIYHRFSMSRSGEFSGQSSTPAPTFGAFGSVGRSQIQLEH